MAGPSAWPTPISPLALPSRSGARSRARILALQGKIVLSPIPSRSRNKSRPRKPPATPIKAVAADQMATPIASVR